LKARYGEQVEFLAIYVREAHPTTGWRMQSNDKEGVVFAQPRTDAERAEVAEQCCTKLKMTMPLLVDAVDDRVGHLYSGMPDRLYLIDRNGRVAYKSGRGPFGFKPGELEQAIVMHLLDDGTPAKPARTRHGVPLLSDKEAWAKLPEAEAGSGAPLPGWGRALAAALPRTTAGMLEMDRVYRTRGLADAKLRAMARWVAAHANKCAYGEAYALADLRRAGGAESDIIVLQGDWSNLPASTQRVLVFARKLTLHAYKVTDVEVADLKEDLGESQLVALVQLLAYANFQDRLVLTLGLDVEPAGPLPPSEVRFRKPYVGGTGPERQALATKPQPAGSRVDNHEWTAIDFTALQEQMKSQRARQPRISVPTFEGVRQYLPNRPANQPLRIRWSLVSVGHSPELANAWLGTMRTFGEESKQDRVFEELLFWVVTRSLQCFY
jgi:alkylhydroperoxidase family enzyme